MLNVRKTALTGLVVVAMGACWLAKSVAQETKTSPGVLLFSREKLDASFAKADTQSGSANLWSRTTSAGTFDVHTNSRHQAGAAQVYQHKVFTAVVYIVSGEATMVIGGDGVTGVAAPPDKYGALSVPVGQSHHIKQGDVVIVPPGTPHSYKDVKEPFHYLEVQVP